MSRRDALHAFQRLEAALRLARLARLGAEALDELLHMRDLALLPGMGLLLLRQFRRTHRFKRAVVAAVAGDALMFDMRNGLHATIEKVAVMRNQQ